MKFVAEINVMPHKALLDPQGKAVTSGMNVIGLPDVSNVRVGKHLTMELEAATETEARQKVEIACTRLLVNQVMEYYEYTVKTV